MLSLNKFKLILSVFIYLICGCFDKQNSICSAQKIVDSEAVLPSYERLHEVVKTTLKSWAYAWSEIHKLTDEIRMNNRSHIEKQVFPKIMRKLLPSHTAIKTLDWHIRYRRKPAGYLDALLDITKLEQLQKLAKEPLKEKYGRLKLRWFELSSAGTQMERFYNKRMRDYINGGEYMVEIINSFNTYNSLIWTAKDGTTGIHEMHQLSESPGIVMKKLLMDDGTDVFQGLRALTDAYPRVLIENHFEPGTCEAGEKYLYIEPNGTDLPFYLLFFLALVDVKEFMIRNFIQFHNNIFFNVKLTNETELITEMNSRIQKKIELFDAALGQMLIAGGPMYPIIGGVAICDPAPKGPNDLRRNFTLGESYEKLTNFIKVFVAPEQELHKSGTCRITCDLLDVTYERCAKNDTDCQWERERECLLYKGRCDKFDPPCPTGQYRCQNSTGLMTVCPSSRPDRLYEFIKGEDPFAAFHFGKQEEECKNKTRTYVGGWRMEEDVLLNTPHFCEICTCYCFEPLSRSFGNETTRYFSIRSVQADIKGNRIVVGVKLHRVKDQIHIAIASAFAKPNHKVDQSTVTWHYPKYEEDPNYVVRLHKDMRTMNLDDVATRMPDRVVTGIRFYNETYLGKLQYQYVGIEIMTHQLDPNGTVKLEGGLFRRNGNNTVNRQMHSYLAEPDSPDDPINANGPTLPDTTSNEFVVFVGSSLEKDAAQSTIPYLDTQSVIADHPTWLRGIGIFHKGRKGYGGYLGFKIIEHRFR